MGIQYSGAIVLPQGGFTVKKAVTSFDGTVLVAQFEDLTDGSGTGKIITLNGDAALTTTQYKNGTKSLYCGRAIANYASFGISTDYDFGSSTDYTLECWYYPTGTTGSPLGAMDYLPNSGPHRGYSFEHNVGEIRFLSRSDDGDLDLISSGGQGPVINQWSHLAVSREGSTNRLFINGTKVDEIVSTKPVDTYGLDLRSSRGDWESVNGYVDGIIVTRTAKYTTDFTPI